MQLLELWDLQWSEKESVTINLLSTAKLNSYFLGKKRNLKMNSNIFIAPNGLFSVPHSREHSSRVWIKITILKNLSHEYFKKTGILVIESFFFFNYQLRYNSYIFHHDYMSCLKVKKTITIVANLWF